MENSLKEIITQRKYKGTALLDPRCKLFLLISIGFVSYFLTGNIPSLLLIITFGLLLGFGNGASWAVKMIVLYIIISYLNALLRHMPIPGLTVMMTVFGVTVLKMIPIVMVGRWVLKTTEMDDLIVAFQRMKMPQSVIISFVVTVRYMPTLVTEYRMIRNTMAIRGICDTWCKKLLHPLSTIEFILIPLLMRCLKVADELAASGSTRGLEKEEVRYAINPVRWSVRETITVAIAVIFLFVLTALDNSSIGSIVLWRM